MRYYRAFIVAFLAVCLGFLTACSDGPANATDREQLTYDEIVNTGLANVCPELDETARGSIEISSDQTYQITDMCLQPQRFFVKEEGKKRRAEEFVEGKILTRSTTSLDQVEGTVEVSSDGVISFQEEGGIDFQPITVQLPGGEQIPFMFTIKELDAKSEPGFESINTSTDLKGDLFVPSYRGAVFLDPKGRGIASGYDNAIALPANADGEELTRANQKRYQTGEGEMSLQITKVDGETGEIAGNFVSIQPSDTDMGADDPEEVKIKGTFYGRVAPKID
ncbi:photosystem II manganese-stabilizing polypeptide [Spirulina sp. CS-785/01]|uniref:photosystem II manganese-stabilizing polypeptide n=1 Tax=Spirulina sp. CS-785/01 TaxID=3021716 RepID=UPI00232DB4AF|nr:photosystem II manganese-stabilizing polypeptide [Spirulina sp. CS-785/01]MDB9312782.1 photosystem II manganese-stabilizing polypeptide [Spirulina sp. CS-785/01]